MSQTATATAASTATAPADGGPALFNPAPMMKLVEVIKPLTASEETIAAALEFAAACGKDAVQVEDRAGFIVNALLIPYILSAVRRLESGFATAEDIDQGMVRGAAHPMGPLALADLIGLDVCVDILEVLHRELGEDKYRPCPLLRKMVAAGRLGRKSGQGFYSY